MRSHHAGPRVRPSFRRCGDRLRSAMPSELFALGGVHSTETHILLGGGAADRLRLGAHFVRCRFVLSELRLVFFANRALVAPSISMATLWSVPAVALCARLIRATFFDTSPWSCTLPFVV